MATKLREVHHSLIAVLCLGVLAVALSAGSSSDAAPPTSNVNVVNTPSNPVPVSVQGTSSVTGSVTVTNPTSNPVPVSVQGTGSVTGSVTVTNPASNPVPTQNVGGGAATQVGQPVSKIVNLTCNNNGTASCTVNGIPFAVPSGQALVITDVQWRVFHDTGDTDFVFLSSILSSNSVSLPTVFAAPVSSTGIFGGQAHLGPLSSVSAFSNGSGVVFLQGYLVPNQ